jgi:hypothetical protein
MQRSQDFSRFVLPEDAIWAGRSRSFVSSRLELVLLRVLEGRYGSAVFSPFAVFFPSGDGTGCDRVSPFFEADVRAGNGRVHCDPRRGRPRHASKALLVLDDCGAS